MRRAECGPRGSLFHVGNIFSCYAMLSSPPEVGGFDYKNKVRASPLPFYAPVPIRSARPAEHAGAGRARSTGARAHTAPAGAQSAHNNLPVWGMLVYLAATTFLVTANALAYFGDHGVIAAKYGLGWNGTAACQIIGACLLLIGSLICECRRRRQHALHCRAALRRPGSRLRLLKRVSRGGVLPVPSRPVLLDGDKQEWDGVPRVLHVLRRARLRGLRAHLNGPMAVFS
eukprot:SAG11_NODE_6099_length_1388_cov_1.389449_1_plen_229_part_00